MTAESSPSEAQTSDAQTSDAHTSDARTSDAQTSNGPSPAAEPVTPRTSRLIHEAVAQQAALRPGATAVVGADLTLTYRELDDRAQEWAAALTQRGAGPGTVVPVLLPRSPELVTALLAVLKCGAAYSALDPRWPEQRLARLIAATKPPVVVADGPTAQDGTPWWRPPALDEPLPHSPTHRSAPVSLPRDGTAPAMLFFTSGTSGVPKGVLSPHRATTRLFIPPGFASFGAGRVMMQAAPASWDAYGLEVWSMLTTGGTTVIAEGEYLMPGRLRGLKERHGVDTVWLTASLFNLFVDEDPGCFTGLTQVITGGERLSVPHVRVFLAAHPGIVLLNGYGPVESCVFATTHRVRAADCDLPTGIPVGTPVPRTQVLVLDGDLPVPPGVTGEICLAGEGLADGYLGDADATAAVFTDVPVDGVVTRVYRTGDLGSLDDDGVLHYRGRKDLQVKVAGHRLEPGDVEAHAREVPGVRDCVAVPLAGPDGTYTGISLFYTADPASEPVLEPHLLRTALARRLPAYMVPRRVFRRAALPYTDRGKPDRAALSAAVAQPPVTLHAHEGVHQ
ncbi:amino acid adenylation domain-containing protein [Streptomyces sp. NPDC048290]|uniref:amino acid adenylation domain-containing protein n=1 Tax=Streptomyces sp. NPDC048290 TaxID=3155811 RepID=UPI00341FF99D